MPTRSPRLSRTGRRDRRQPFLPLVAGLGEPTPADPVELLGEPVGIGDRAGREGGQSRCPGVDMPEGEQHLAHRSRMPDARTPDLGHALHGGGTVHEVDRDGIVLARRGERRRLSRLTHERLQVRPCQRTEIEALEHGVPELDETERER